MNGRKTDLYGQTPSVLESDLMHGCLRFVKKEGL